MDRHEPFQRICKLINALPETPFGRTNVLFLACTSLGIRQEPTGLPMTPDRKAGELFWDYEISQLNDRLVFLFDKHHIRPEFLIKGLLAIILDPLIRQIAPGEVDRDIASNQDWIDSLKSQKELSVEMRNDQLTDDAIDGLITTIQKMIDNAAARVQDAHAVKVEIERLQAELLPQHFWPLYAASQLKR